MSLRQHPIIDPAAQADLASNDAPMTPAQAAHLKTLCAQTGDDQAFDETLTRTEATRRIAALQAWVECERHSGSERLPRT